MKLIEKMADFVVLYCQNKGVTINPLKLQKLLYYIQSWHIVKFNKDILFEEMPEAWVNGPVYKTIYKNFKNFYRNDDIKTDLNETALSFKLAETLTSLNLDAEKEKLIFSVLDIYSMFSDVKLVFLTHNETPWNEARKGLSPIERSNRLISSESIYNYYTQRLEKNA